MAINVPTGAPNSSADLQTYLDNYPGQLLELTGETIFEDTSPPVLVRWPKTQLVGKNAKIVQPNKMHGNSIYIAPDPTSSQLIPVRTSLLPGPGHALDVSPGMTAHVDLADAIRNNLNGRSSLRLEFAVWPDSFSATNFGQSVMECIGRLFLSEARTGAVYLGFNPSRILKVRLRTTAGTAELEAPGFLPDTFYYVALDYDGTTIRLAVNGTLVASLAWTGTIVQHTWETWSVGSPPAEWPESNAPFRQPFDGAVDAVSVQPSKGTDFTVPTAKYTSTANRWTCNFETHAERFILGKGSSGTSMNTAWMPWRRSVSAGLGDWVPEFFMKGFECVAGEGGLGITAHMARSGYYEDLKFTGGRMGLNLRNNCFGSAINRVFGTTGSAYARYMLGLNNASWTSVVSNVEGSGWMTGIWSDGGVEINHAFMSGMKTLGYMLQQGGFVLNAVAASDENTAGWLCALGLSKANIAAFGGGFDHFESVGPAVITEESTGSFNNVIFKVAAAAASYFHEQGLDPNDIQVSYPILVPSTGRPLSDRTPPGVQLA